MSRMYEAFRRVNRTRRVEDSVRLRQAVLGTVLIAVLATMLSGAAPMLDAVAALVLLPVGAWVSHVRRGKDNTFLKLLLAIGAALALMRFFGEVRVATSVEDTRQPLAALFLGVQILHGFDLPARRDLGFTLASSLTLVALSATNTHAGLFGVMLLVYAGVAVVSMIEIQRSAARQRGDELREREAAGELRPAEPREEPASMTDVGLLTGEFDRAAAWRRARTVLPVILAGLLLFSLLPRSDTRQLGGLPFRGLPPSLRLPSASILNPGLEGGGFESPTDGSAPIGFNPTAYFGFAENVDLRTVGRLSDDPVLRVRADRPRFWRGIVFDTYTGLGWTRSSEEPPPLFGRPVELRPERLPGADYATVVQTYELIADTPNLVFNAGRASQVYLAGGSVHPWDDDTITTAQIMDEGTIYSVVSLVDVTDPEVLRTREGDVPDWFIDRWTQLPSSVTDRTRALASELTAGLSTNYEKAEAIERWIGDNTEYTLDAEPPPSAGDVVDHFLFESRRGWCEPIASSMVVMLRSVGVPARFATGFQPGQRNPITGVYDVAMSNAHAWVEVHVPGHGWIPFDPTGAVPQAVDGRDAPSIPLVDGFNWLRDRVSALTPDPVRRAVATLGAGAMRYWPVTAGLLVALGAGALVLLRRRREALALAAVPQDPFGRLEHLLAEHGVRRDDWQTPREYVQRVRLHRPDIPEEPLDRVLATEEARRYAPGRPVDDRAASAAVDEIEHALAPIPQ